MHRARVRAYVCVREGCDGDGGGGGDVGVWTVLSVSSKIGREMNQGCFHSRVARIKLLKQRCGFVNEV